MVSTRNRKLKSRTPPPKKKKAPAKKKKAPAKKSKSPAPKKKTPAKKARAKTPAKKKAPAKKSKSPAPKKKTPVKKARAKTPPKKKTPAKKSKSPAPKKKTPVKKSPAPKKARAKSPAKKAAPAKAAAAPVKSSGSPLPISTEQVWTITNYCFLSMLVVALVPDSFGITSKAHDFLIPGAASADLATFTRFCTLLGLMGYTQLFGAAPQNKATACASMSFTFTLWTYIAYTQAGEKEWGVIGLYGVLAVLNFFGGYGQNSIAADGTDSQKFIWYMASFLWTLTAIQDLITPGNAMDINRASNDNLVRMIALAVIAACSINSRSPPSDLAEGLKWQRVLFMLYILTPIVTPMLSGNMQVTESIKDVANMKGMQMVAFNFLANMLLSA